MRACACALSTDRTTELPLSLAALSVGSFVRPSPSAPLSRPRAPSAWPHTRTRTVQYVLERVQIITQFDVVATHPAMRRHLNAAVVAPIFLLLAHLSTAHAFLAVPVEGRLALRSSPQLAQMPSTLLTRPALNARGAMACVQMVAVPAAVSTVAKIITAPLVLGLNIFGGVLKIAWRLAAFAAFSWVVTRFLLMPRLRAKVSGFTASGLKFMAMAGQAASFAADQWHARNLQAVAELDRAQSTAERQSEAAPSGSQKATWAPSAPQPPGSAPSSAGAGTAAAATAAAAAATTDFSGMSEEEIRTQVGAMRVKALKAELTSLGIPHADAVEKADLVARLVDARLNGSAGAAAGSSTSTQPSPPAAAVPAPPPSPPPPPSTNPFANPFGGGAGFPDSPEDFDKFASELGVDPKDAMAQAEAMASNPDAMAMMMRMQANPRVMEAVMDIAMNGEAAAAKYENDEEVLAMMQEMEKLSGQFPGMM